MEKCLCNLEEFIIYLNENGSKKKKEKLKDKDKKIQIMGEKFLELKSFGKLEKVKRQIMK